MSDSTETREPQYSILFDTIRRHGVSTFGLMVNESWNNDPKRTLFTLSRYKFVAKMLAGKASALEIGCADAFGTRLVQQTVKEVHAVDFDQVFIDDIKARYNPNWPLEYRQHDILEGPYRPKVFEAAFALDVLEHIGLDQEDTFIENIKAALESHGIFIAGIPSLESQIYASPQSKAGHVNCKSGPALKSFLEKHFEHVFLFSMNDEVVHTGFTPMAHYLLALCCVKKSVYMAEPA
jgi:2-polyprenyl-3-methyl-5-hydroxy-6-metoxy-1,4-benzoquinol methylase